MEEEEEDDIYAPDESFLTAQESSGHSGINGQNPSKKDGAGSAPKDEESGEEIEEDDSDSVRSFHSPSRNKQY